MTPVLLISMPAHLTKYLLLNKVGRHFRKYLTFCPFSGRHVEKAKIG